LVRKSYDYPVDTFSTNVMGTVNVLEALRGCKSVSACLCITSDKCYENMESPYAYRENDPLGGGDPYSASKGCAEIVVASYRRSFFGKEGDSKHLIGVSTARAGNVIGGGDWAADRIFPDSVKSLSKGNDVPIRNLKAIRPWQHVLEPLAGYLWLTAKMAQSPANFSDAWNFGPYSTSCVSVETLVEKIIKAWGWGGMINLSKGQTGGRHEANFLRLDCSKAFGLIDWHPSLTLDDSVKFATEWYKNFYHKKNFDARAFTEKQIRHYVEISHRAGLPWAKL
jgi:CDP-glucose 4,6-dehydratase